MKKLNGMIQRKAHAKRGFSLIELLVVVAILAILITMVLPSITRYSLRAKGIICFSNIRNLALANTQFASANDGHLPRPGWYGHGVNWLYANNLCDKLEDLKDGALWPYINDYSTYRCAVDIAPAPDDYISVWRPGNSRMITSYCMNGSVANYSGSEITHRITSFKSDDVIFWETDENNESRGAWHDASNQPRESLSGRHSSRGRRYENYDTDDKVKGTIGNLDGTAEWILRRDDIPNNGDFDEIAFNKGGWHPQPNRLWNKPSNPLN